jgi:hypothetical protein
MAEIAIPLAAAPRRSERAALPAWLRTLTAAAPTPDRTGTPCCFGRMGAKDAMVARGLAAALAIEQRGVGR